MPSDIKIRSLIGAGIRTYIPSIVQVRSEVLRDLPYLRSGSVEEDTFYLQRLSQIKDAIAVLVFDGTQVIGVAMGLPLENERPLLKKPLFDQGENLADYYLFGICVLLPSYRGRGIAHHFFDIRETHVQHLKRFKKVCLTELVSPKTTQEQSSAYISLDSLWKKRGYVQHQNLLCKYTWRLEPISLVYWIKELSSSPVEESVARGYSYVEAIRSFNSKE